MCVYIYIYIMYTYTYTPPWPPQVASCHRYSSACFLVRQVVGLEKSFAVRFNCPRMVVYGPKGPNTCVFANWTLWVRVHHQCPRLGFVKPGGVLTKVLCCFLCSSCQGAGEVGRDDGVEGGDDGMGVNCGTGAAWKTLSLEVVEF